MSGPQKEKDSPAGKPVSQEKTETKQGRTVKRAKKAVYDASVVEKTFTRVQALLVKRIDRLITFADAEESLSDMAVALSHVTSQLRTIQREKDREAAE